MEVLPEHQDGAVLRLLRQLVPQLPLDGGSNEARVAVLDGAAHRLTGSRIVSLDQMALQEIEDLLLRSLDPDLQGLFLLTAVDGEHPVAGCLCHRFRKIVIGLVDGLLFRVLRLGGKNSPALRHAAHIGADHLGVRETLRQDIAGALDGILRSQNALLL